MTDILVRVPSSSMDHFWADHDGNYEFWRLGRTPRQFLDQDWVFFALGGYVVAYATHAFLRPHLRNDVWWPAEHFVKLEPPIHLALIELQVPRGFAYCGHTKLRQLVASRCP